MPSKTNGRRVRVPLDKRCSVRQYAYHDIGGLSKQVRGILCSPHLRQLVSSNPGRKGGFVARMEGPKSLIQSSSYALGIKKCNTFVAICIAGPRIGSFQGLVRAGMAEN